MRVIAVWDGVSGIGFNLCVSYLDNFRLSKWSTSTQSLFIFELLFLRDILLQPFLPVHQEPTGPFGIGPRGLYSSYSSKC